MCRSPPPIRCWRPIIDFRFAPSGSASCIWWSGTILTVVIVGIAILLWWFVWSLVRNVKGTLALNDNKPIANPASWMFG